ncbi:MAG: BCCT family transporter [Brachybacterium sp.]|nr:BCCT family transporter [Brachybacterium sp.]
MDDHPAQDPMTPSAQSGSQRPARPERGMERARRLLRRPTDGGVALHPGLIPGISVEDAHRSFPLSKAVFVVALAVSAALVAWAAFVPENVDEVGTSMQEWVVVHLGWFLGAVMVIGLLFMFAIGFGPTGKIRLGADDTEPEYSRASWISMLFAAGLGIGLIFYGPMEPLSHFLEPAPWVEAEPETQGAVLPAMSQGMLHQASLAWGIYALVGGAIAYSAYRRGRLPLISSVFEPVFPDGSHKKIGKVIDIFAVLVTLLGTSTSLGIGALQIQTGTMIVTGWDLEGNLFLVGIITVLSVLFIVSAVTGIKRGIRILSNINMGFVAVLAGFVLIAGPTMFILDALPASIYSFVQNLPAMLSVSPSQGDEEQAFVLDWTMMFWGWWIAWSPFVGMFFAKISKGRTLREYVVVVVLVPSFISLLWYVVFGATAIFQEMEGPGLEIEDTGENVMFDLLANLPLTGITQILVIIAIVIFFVTAADSATNVVGSMSQSGRPVPSTMVTITWGVMLGLLALFLLLAGGENALSGLQAVMVTGSAPFAVIVLGMMVSWAKDLSTDPYMIRRRYAKEAVSRGVMQGIDEMGDDFVFRPERVVPGQGAGADFTSEDPELSSWYTDCADPEDPDGSHAADDAASDGDDSEATGEGTEAASRDRPGSSAAER